MYILNKSKLILLWLLRAWPLWIEILIVLGHILALQACIDIAIKCWPDEEINKLIALFLQLLGGGLILVSIDSNLTSFSKTSLYLVFANYLRSFPLRKRHYTLTANAGKYTIKGKRAKLKHTKHPKNVNEYIEYLQEQIDKIESDANSYFDENDARIDKLETHLNKKTDESISGLKELEATIGNSTRSSISIQLMGVFLMIHGSVAGYLA